MQKIPRIPINEYMKKYELKLLSDNTVSDYIACLERDKTASKAVLIGSDRADSLKQSPREMTDSALTASGHITAFLARKSLPKEAFHQLQAEQANWARTKLSDAHK